MKAKKKAIVPAFSSEADEARWWYEHRDRLDQAFGEAAKAGKLRRLTGSTFPAKSKPSVSRKNADRFQTGMLIGFRQER